PGAHDLHNRKITQRQITAAAQVKGEALEFSFGVGAYVLWIRESLGEAPDGIAGNSHPRQQQQDISKGFIIQEFQHLHSSRLLAPKIQSCEEGETPRKQVNCSLGGISGTSYFFEFLIHDKEILYSKVENCPPLRLSFIFYLAFSFHPAVRSRCTRAPAVLILV